MAGLPERNGDFRVSENELEGTKKRAEKKISNTDHLSRACADSSLPGFFCFARYLIPRWGASPARGQNAFRKAFPGAHRDSKDRVRKAAGESRAELSFFLKKEETLVLLASTLASLFFILSTFDSFLLLSFFIFPNDKRLEPASSPPPPSPSPPFARS